MWLLEVVVAAVVVAGWWLLPQSLSLPDIEANAVCWGWSGGALWMMVVHHWVVVVVVTAIVVIVVSAGGGGDSRCHEYQKKSIPAGICQARGLWGLVIVNASIEGPHCCWILGLAIVNAARGPHCCWIWGWL